MPAKRSEKVNEGPVELMFEVYAFRSGEAGRDGRVVDRGGGPSWTTRHLVVVDQLQPLVLPQPSQT